MLEVGQNFQEKWTYLKCAAKISCTAVTEDCNVALGAKKE